MISDWDEKSAMPEESEEAAKVVWFGENEMLDIIPVV